MRSPMDWRVKGTIQKLLGVLPGGEPIHYWLQRLGGGLRRFGEECDSKIEDLGLMIGHRRAARVRVRGTRVLQVGTGWSPTFPLGLYVLGAARVDTFDLNRHLKPDLVRALVARLGAKPGALAALDGDGDSAAAGRAERLARLAERIARGATLEAATDGCVVYRAPPDAAATGPPPGPGRPAFSDHRPGHPPPAAA